MRAFLPLISSLAIVIGGVGSGAAQGPGREPKRVAPSLDAVLPVLNGSVVRVRSGTANLTGIRVTPDAALVTLPAGVPPTAGYQVAVFDTWAAAAVIATNTHERMVLVRIPAAQSPALNPVTLEAVGRFVVGAASLGPKLDIRTVWLEPGETPALPAGTVVFTVDGGFVGLMVLEGWEGGRTVMLRGSYVLNLAAAMARKA